MLYSTEQYPAGANTTDPSAPATRQGSAALAHGDWDGKAGAVMTSMVVSLKMCQLVSDFVLVHAAALTVDQMDMLLSALETQYWHARSFNDNLPLRSQLHNVGFMKRGEDSGGIPHLLEQEVHTASRILRVVFDIYSSAKNSAGGAVSYLELDAFSGPLVSRYDCTTPTVIVFFFLFQLTSFRPCSEQNVPCDLHEILRPRERVGSATATQQDGAKVFGTATPRIHACGYGRCPGNCRVFKGAVLEKRQVDRAVALAANPLRGQGCEDPRQRHLQTPHQFQRVGSDGAPPKLIGWSYGVVCEFSVSR